jgi:assimilatory nitrate reductase catalytic subunit
MGPRSVRTTCPYCGVGCGVIATLDAEGNVSVAGDPDHPANFGRLCSKGSALAETLSLDDRLLAPTIDGVASDWDTALETVADTLTRTIAELGRESVAFYVSGQLLTEDYYVANKLMKGFIGTANIDTNSRLCMASSVAGHKRAFGSDTVPGCYQDLEAADLVVLVGSNLAWCHPVLFQRLAAAKAERPGLRIVVIDPRATATAEIADLHLPIAPDSDVLLFAGLLAHLDITGRIDRNFVMGRTSGWQETLLTVQGLCMGDVVRGTGLAEADIRAFYELFAATRKTVTIYSQGVNQSASGTDKVNAIINCHLLTGRIGQPGMGPFSVTGQPNAMGGREVGGLANQLACHMDLENESHRKLVRQYWNSPRIADRAGLKAVDLFSAVADRRIKAVWIMGTNPAVSMPDADNVARALAACPFVVVSDVNGNTDTARYADVLLPAAAWGEKSGTVTNSERRISRQRSFAASPGMARPDWWIICEVARRMGFADAFDYDGPADIFREYAALSGLENAGTRDLDIAGLAALSDDGYDDLAPVQWPVRSGTRPGPWERRFFARERFFTPDGLARFVPVTVPLAVKQDDAGSTLVLNTGRVRDQWHTMTRTGKSARLSQHIAEPYCEIHPRDASRLGIQPATLVEVSSARGRAVARAVVTGRQQPGSVFVPMHWTGQYASAGRIDAVTVPEVDPVSGQPRLKSTEVSVRPFAAAWYGFAVLRQRPAELDADYWAVARAEGGWRVELAGTLPVADWEAFAGALLGQAVEDVAETMSYGDATSGHFRFTAFAGAQLVGALFVAPAPVPVSRVWAAGLLRAEVSDALGRSRILAGRDGANAPDRAAIVCSCFSVGVNQIVDAIANHGCASVDAVGKCVNAGTNCGSCRTEIQGLIKEIRFKEAV